MVNTHYNVAKPIPAEKLKSGFTFMSGVTGWEASFSDGKLELFPDNGIPTSGDPHRAWPHPLGGYGARRVPF